MATAAHLIEDYSNEEIFLLTRETPHNVSPIILGRGFDSELDLAWLELPPAAAESIDRSFLSLNQLQPAWADDSRDLLVVHGFPVKLSQPDLEARILGVQPLCYATQTLLRSEWPSDGDPSKDLYLEYPDEGLVGAGGGPAPPTEAPGLSGGGIWSLGVPASIWTPDAMRLVGVQFAWKRWKYLRGRQIQHWLELVASSKPELRADIDAVLGAA